MTNNTCTICPLCDRPGTLLNAKDVARVPCNLRKFKDDLFTLWRCTNCGSIHCAEGANLPKYYADYLLKNDKLDRGARGMYENRLRRLERLGLRRSDRILDYGGGIGLFALFLKEKGYSNAFCYDPFVPEYADSKILEQAFDAVVSYAAIGCDDDPIRFLRTMARLVGPNGLLAIGATRADRLDLSQVKEPQLHPPYHRHIFSEGALIAAAQKQNLIPVEIYRRHLGDRPIPTINLRFLVSYIIEMGGLMDCLYEHPLQYSVFLKSPVLIWWAFFGYLFPLRTEMLITFRKNE